MAQWFRKNAVSVAVMSFAVATTGVASLVKVARLAPDLGDMTLALAPLIVVVGLAVAASLFGLAGVAIVALGGRAHAGSPTVGAPH